MSIASYQVKLQTYVVSTQFENRFLASTYYITHQDTILVSEQRALDPHACCHTNLKKRPRFNHDITTSKQFCSGRKKSKLLQGAVMTDVGRLRRAGTGGSPPECPGRSPVPGRAGQPLCLLTRNGPRSSCCCCCHRRRSC
jgi:hypothetical protein